MLNQNTDIIRAYNGDYANINTKNSLIQKMIAMSAEHIYSFGLIFGRIVEHEQAEQMKNTYWLRVSQAGNSKYDDDVQISVIK